MTTIRILTLLLTTILQPSPANPFHIPGIQIAIAILPNDLEAIQTCRRTAYQGRTNLLSAAKSFCNADQIQRQDYVCIIAKADGRVVGTADLNRRTHTVNNVYVMPEARKRGIGRLLMEAVEEAVEPPAELKLTVQCSNKAAMGLYRRLGFRPPPVYRGLVAISSATSMDFLIEMKKTVV